MGYGYFAALGVTEKIPVAGTEKQYRIVDKAEVFGDTLGHFIRKRHIFDFRNGGILRFGAAVKVKGGVPDIYGIRAVR